MANTFIRAGFQMNVVTPKLSPFSILNITMILLFSFFELNHVWPNH